MRTWLTKARSQVSRLTIFGAGAAVALLAASSARADEAGGEANLKLPDLSQVSFHGMDGHKLLLFGILFCLLGLAFGLVIYTRLKNRSEEHTSELQSRLHLVCRLLLEKKKTV